MSISDYAPDLPTFTGMALDRAMSEREDPGIVGRLLEDPEARMIAASHEGVLVGNGGESALARVPLTAEVWREPILLGLDDGAGLFAVNLDQVGPGGGRSSPPMARSCCCGTPARRCAIRRPVWRRIWWRC